MPKVRPENRPRTSCDERLLARLIQAAFGRLSRSKSVTKSTQRSARLTVAGSRAVPSRDTTFCRAISVYCAPVRVSASLLICAYTIGKDLASRPGELQVEDTVLQDKRISPLALILNFEAMIRETQHRLGLSMGPADCAYV